MSDIKQKVTTDIRRRASVSVPKTMLAEYLREIGCYIPLGQEGTVEISGGGYLSEERLTISWIIDHSTVVREYELGEEVPPEE